MWKILTAQIRKEIYFSLISRGLFPDEQKGCCKGSRGTAALIYIDQHILNESKKRRKNLAMAWIDYKKACDMVPQSWIINCLKMYKISHEIINFIEKNMKNWRVELTAGGKSLIQRFLKYMDDIKLFAKNEKELETQIPTVRIYSQDVGMEFGIEKCALLVMKSGKRQLNEGIELSNQDKIRTLAENETYKCLGILEADTIKQVEMKNKIQKEYLKRIRKLLKTKLSSRNLIKGINTWAVTLVRYSGPIL